MKLAPVLAVTAALLVPSLASAQHVGHMHDLGALISANPTIEADQTALETARRQLRTDVHSETDRTQLGMDEVTRDRTAIANDEHALAADEAKLRADLRALRTAIATVTF